MEQKRTLNNFEKLLLVISLILFVINLLIVFNVIYVQKCISSILLFFIMFILSYTYFKKQNKLAGYIFIVIAFEFLITFLILLI
ncbi:hypothetical protein BTJ66_08750 [Staphylococcus edaphicus]|uniref:DUF3953 domain-containing protein n=1 Tax=Staphylococcus edaphicus TaxID=1955013 RepID=A0A2C6WNL3_9STAP|nr:hypothetical protein BTJ66_08750 [Staphylococcus edaphicus]